MTKNLFNSDSYIYDDKYLNAKTLAEWVDEWSFKKADTAVYTHKIHRYPAMFIPQLVRKVILEYTNKGDTVLDIFNGSGSTMIECCLTERNSIGIELNPLAILIAKVKTTPLDLRKLSDAFNAIENGFYDDELKFDLIDFKNVDFWFHLSVKKYISKLLCLFDNVQDNDLKDFLKVCLSEIIRNVSTCNHSGFKMHRDIKKVDVEISQQDFFKLFKSTYTNNYEAIRAFDEHFTEN
jgi:site-specific DNA-methyltransferase (cytosine-N4-specific)